MASSTMTSNHLSTPFRGLPYLALTSPLNISFQDLSNNSDKTSDKVYDQVVKEATRPGFAPPPESEVLMYMNKSLPAAPIVSERLEQVQETKVQAVKCQTPCVTVVSENRPASCSASVRTSFTQQSIAPTVTEQQSPASAAWLARMRKRDEGNQKCHVQFCQSRSST